MGEKVENPIKLISLMLFLSSRLTTFRSLFLSFVSFFSYDLQVKYFNISCEFFSIHPQEKKSSHFPFVYFAFFSVKNILIHKLFRIHYDLSFAHQGQIVHKYFFNRCFVFHPLFAVCFYTASPQKKHQYFCNI